MNTQTVLALVWGIVALTGGDVLSSDETDPQANGTTTVVLASDIEWEQLNPARGDNSPSAGTLWGDRNGAGPSGFLLKPVAGFVSPPHVHSAPYRGVVIYGQIHNAAPDAAEMYLPAGSYWTQPSGQVHITAAKGSSLAYIEIENGYDVLPVDQKSENKTRPVWLPARDVDWKPLNAESSPNNGPQIAQLWENLQNKPLHGSLLKLPAGFAGEIHTPGPEFHAVVNQGQTTLTLPEMNKPVTLAAGSCFSSTERADHRLAVETKEDCVIYVRAHGTFQVTAENNEE